MPQKCWCLVNYPEHLKERPHVQVKDLIRGVLATQTSPTPADAQICSQTILHCGLSCPISYLKCLNSPSQLRRSLQRLLGPCQEWVLINSPKSSCFGSLLLSILTRCPSHLHRCFLIISAMFSVTHTHTHANTHTHTQIRTQTHTLTTRHNIHTNTHACTYTHTTRMYTYIHTCTYIHTQHTYKRKHRQLSMYSYTVIHTPVLLLLCDKNTKPFT